MSSPKEIINRIRKTRFGIGLDNSNLSADHVAALEDKENVLNDAARLASEINHQEATFCL